MVGLLDVVGLIDQIGEILSRVVWVSLAIRVAVLVCSLGMVDLAPYLNVSVDYRLRLLPAVHLLRVPIGVLM